MTTTDTLLADLADVLDRAAKLAKDLSATLAGPPVDMLAIPDDPLREFRTTGGRVSYETTYADEVKVGDWVQACHGDTDWYCATEADAYPQSDDGREWVRIVLDGTANFWLATDAIRVARRAADVVAAQEQAS